MAPTVHDVLTFHRIDRGAYDRLLFLGAGHEPARDAVALLMWLHRSGACARVDPIARVPALVRDPAAAALLVDEARAVLDVHAAASVSATPFLSCLCGDDGARVRRLLLACCPRRGVAEVLHGVGALVFDDRLHALVQRYEEEGGARLPSELAAPYLRLYGTSAALAAAAQIEEEDGRSLFITFSKGFPLTREEIIGFFTEMWGADCVAKVMMEKTPAGEPPTYGRIVLRRASIVSEVLGGRPLVKLVVNGRQLWARKYVPRLSMAT
ncbi:hypothetical protein QOZ80_4AG0321350 [Eleusine coracana subsp. coracana]|nr:hypothetical protein QOZ80_4AG0321350 [Eleusine coracana subsp. coracana]